MEFRENKNTDQENTQHESEPMQMRGSTRPMMHEGTDMGKSKGMNKEHKMEMLHMHHMQTLWVYWMIIILGAWVMLAPLTFSYGEGAVLPSGGREVWLSLPQRITVLKWSDIVCGALLMVFGWRSLTPNRPLSLWICCFIGIWLNIAPLLLWSPSMANYLNDTLCGTLIIALTILIPGMPNMMVHMEPGPDIPPGWSYNPSSWPQRWSMMILGFLGWVVSRYLAAFQLGFIDQVWDPFFGNSSMQVLNSDMSMSLPVSDAGLGALAYTFEFLMGWMGSPARWRTMPWMVTFFGILVIPLGLVHIFLVISQPVAVGHWCTFCLLAAAIMLPMIPLEIDEVIAMGQFMVQAKRKGENFWKVFWKGGTLEEGEKDKRTPELMELPKAKGKVVSASLWGMSAPLTLMLSAVAGVALMSAPGIAGIAIQDTAADICHLCGALIVVVSVISMGEVVRRLRYLNVLLGLIAGAGTWLSDSGSMVLNIAALVLGAVTIALAFPRGVKKEQYGLWDKYVK